MSGRFFVGVVFAVATILAAVAPFVRGALELPVAQHHLVHAGILAGSVIAALLLTPGVSGRRTSPGWLVVATLAPPLAMVLMWPTEYSFFETHPAGHVVEHLGLAILGFASASAGQRFAAGVGWAAGASVVGMAILAAWGFGVSPPPVHF